MEDLAPGLREKIMRKIGSGCIALEESTELLEAIHWIRRIGLTSFFLLCISMQANAESFEAQGSDLLMGVGPAAIAVAGAATSQTTGVYASYWNPAGLSWKKQNELSISHQIKGSLEPVSFVGISGRYQFSGLNDYNFGYALAWLPRLHVKANGAFDKDSFESLFIRFALPDIPEDFDGDTESKTRDFRLSLSMSPANDRSWSIGSTFAYIRCVSIFCGSTLSAPDSPYTAETTANAFAINIGIQYRLSDQIGFGAHFKDINTTLDVKTTTVENSQQREEIFYSDFPYDLNFGFFWKPDASLTLSSDYQLIFGNYGAYDINLQLWKTGMEKQVGNLFIRTGLVIPVSLNTGFSDDLRPNLPAPVLPTFGLGWKSQLISIDFVLYPHPAMSYQQQAIVPTIETSISILL